MLNPFVLPSTPCEKCAIFPCKLCQFEIGSDWQVHLVLERMTLQLYARAWGVGTGEKNTLRSTGIRCYLSRVPVPVIVQERCSQHVRDLTNWIAKLQAYPGVYDDFSDHQQEPPKRVAVKAIRPIVASKEPEKSTLRLAEDIRHHLSRIHKSMMVPERCAQRVRDLTNLIVKLHAYPVAHGGFSDVWKCQLRHKQQPPERVAVKAIRSVFANKEELQVKRKAIEAIERELGVWAVLRHMNVLPLYGITSGFGPFISFVCPWADNGTLSEYLEKFESQLDLKKRMSLLEDIASGLQYLHGDLSSSNVLIFEGGRACLSDFGLSTLLEVSETYVSYPGNIRWAAPELLDGYTEGTLASQLSSTEVDIYSFGSIMLQILSGKQPFHGIQRVAQIVIMVSRGQKPHRELLWDERDIPDVMWKFMEACWANPSERPSSEKIVHFIRCQLSAM